MKKLLERIARIAQGFEVKSNAPAKPVVHKASVQLFKDRLGTLEKELKALELELAQMKGEYAAEMRHSKKEAREEITNAYRELKAEGEATMTKLTRSISHLQRKIASGRA